MRVQIYNDINEYINDTFELLKKHEIQNNLIIGNCIKALKGAFEDIFLATVKDDDNNIRIISMVTPPYPFLVYEVDNIECNDGLIVLINYLINNKEIPGIVTEKELAKRFVELYIKAVDIDIKIGTNLRIYQLDKVIHSGNSNGKLRKANKNDLFYLPYWNVEYQNDCNLRVGVREIEKMYLNMEKKIEDGYVYIWEDEYPVSQVGTGRFTLNGAVISLVYTPPYLRKKGYATASVAALSQKLLDEGYKFCALFTDLANPISNSIYKKIGYYEVCDYDEYWFTKK